MINAQDIKIGTCIRMDGKLYFCIDFLHVKPGKGNTFMRTKLKDVVNGYVLERRFNIGEKLEDVRVERRPHQCPGVTAPRSRATIWLRASPCAPPLKPHRSRRWSRLCLWKSPRRKPTSAPPSACSARAAGKLKTSSTTRGSSLCRALPPSASSSASPQTSGRQHKAGPG